MTHDIAQGQKGYIHLNSWAGHTKVAVSYVGQTAKKVRVRLLQDARLPGRPVKAGDVVLVPKDAVTWGDEWDADNTGRSDYT